MTSSFKKSTTFPLFFILLFTVLFSGGCLRNEPKTTEKTVKVGNDSVNYELKQLTSSVIQSPDKIQPYLDRAVYYAKNSMPNEALKDINYALTLNQNDPEVYAALSDVYMYDGKAQRSLDALKRARELSPNEGKYDVKMARLYLTMSDYKQTFNTLREGLRKDPKNAEAFFISGLAHEEMGDTTKAIENYQLAVARKQDYYDALKQLGILYSIKKDRLAIDYLRNASTLKPDYPEPLYILGMFYQENDDPEKALSVYEEILLSQPGYILAHYNKGYVYLVYQQEYQQAIEAFTKAIELDADYADAYYNRALAYELLGDKTKARTEYEKVLRMRVNDEKTVEGLNRLDAL
ncbi:MAG: tetratricopeptide repeat protein [Lentimicrobium sp.]|nr:tetratricopeptide repeat protein [Lentimicrobium sp.]